MDKDQRRTRQRINRRKKWTVECDLKIAKKPTILKQMQGPVLNLYFEKEKNSINDIFQYPT